MIHVFVTRAGNDPANRIDGIKISVTEDSLPAFEQLIHRALNCWDSAPKEIKDLGDMLTHGRVTQDHTYKPINSTHGNGDMYSQAEQSTIKTYIASFGFDAWFRRIRENTVHEVLNGKAKD